ncbi:Wadjet anti-phage system protein JetD domain-containing protein [Bacillus dakarensis]|uniref:Wadjet anti-phage system protein JetD domain-containing protein n=1 Tax=Robertmurraya dakarensis TaxID=1926278 RepID=UPI000981E718|nr:Wadjet anti-phage system protein JetD domain-containing protein [Bacillus dakarensis]
MRQKMKKWLTNYLTEMQLPSRKRRIDAQTIEDYIIKNKFNNSINYQVENGYQVFVQVMKELIEEGMMTPVKNSQLNGRRPSIHTQWWLLPAPVESSWSDNQIMAFSDFLNLSKYRQHPEWQTDLEWGNIEKIYNFLKQRENFQWVTREERAFQLFGEEKYFSFEGRVLLQRLQLTLDDLKAKVYGEPFVFWPAPNRLISDAKTVLIVENLSFYHTCRQLLNSGGNIKGINPDLLIYGEGKKIEKSFSFLNEIINKKGLTIYYVGDIDPEGWGIYVRLKENYPEENIQLAISIYDALIDKGKTNRTETEQVANTPYLTHVIKEIVQNGREDMATVVKELWENKLRIPQEALSLDTWEE